MSSPLDKCSHNLQSAEGVAQLPVMKLAKQKQITGMPRAASTSMIAVVSIHDVSAVFVLRNITCRWCKYLRDGHSETPLAVPCVLPLLNVLDLCILFWGLRSTNPLRIPCGNKASSAPFFAYRAVAGRRNWPWRRYVPCGICVWLRVSCRGRDGLVDGTAHCWIAVLLLVRRIFGTEIRKKTLFANIKLMSLFEHNTKVPLGALKNPFSDSRKEQFSLVSPRV